MISDLEALLARVEGATGADREIDLLIGEHFGEADHSGPAYHRPHRLWARHYTASLDAALALVERSGVPGIDAAQLLHQALEDMANGGWRDDQALAPQIALYLIAALLRRMIDARAV
jgi:hypothetical protein